MGDKGFIVMRSVVRFIVFLSLSLYSFVSFSQNQADHSRGAYRYQYAGADELPQAGQVDHRPKELEQFQWREREKNSPDSQNSLKINLDQLEKKTVFTEKTPHSEINRELHEKNKKYLLKFDSFFDVTADYTNFYGRVSDRDASSNIIKVATENTNIKFFRAGDKIKFTVPAKQGGHCIGFIRAVEQKHFVMYVKDLYSCWRKGDYFRRGTQLNLFSEELAQRIRSAAEYRTVLLLRKRDFHGQLNKVNHFVWSYNQKKVQVASDFDRQINLIEKQKQKAMDFLLVKNRDQIRLQRALTKKLYELDRELDHFKIARIEKLLDRWHMDLDYGLPMKDRPQNMKVKADIK